MRRLPVRGAHLAFAVAVLQAVSATAHEVEDHEHRHTGAVSEPHFVLDVGARFLGIDDVDGQSFAAQGTFYAPFAEQMGFAIGGDLGFGSVEGDFGEVLGVHGSTFWRHPESGYVGMILVYDHVSRLDRVNVSGIGGLYLGRVDLSTTLGYDGGDGPDVGLFAFEAAYYTSDAFRLGLTFDVGTNSTYAGGVVLHWQPAEDAPVTLRTDIGGGELDDTGFYRIGLGVTIAFADGKSLRDQLRGDRLLSFE